MPEEFVEFSEAAEAKVVFDWFTELVKVDVVFGGFDFKFYELPVNDMCQEVFYAVYDIFVIYGVLFAVYCRKKLWGYAGIEAFKVKTIL